MFDSHDDVDFWVKASSAIEESLQRRTGLPRIPGTQTALFHEDGPVDLAVQDVRRNFHTEFPPETTCDDLLAKVQIDENDVDQFVQMSSETEAGLRRIEAENAAMFDKLATNSVFKSSDTRTELEFLEAMTKDIILGRAGRAGKDCYTGFSANVYGVGCASQDEFIATVEAEISRPPQSAVIVSADKEKGLVGLTGTEELQEIKHLQSEMRPMMDASYVWAPFVPHRRPLPSMDLTTGTAPLSVELVAPIVRSTYKPLFGAMSGEEASPDRIDGMTAEECLARYTKRQQTDTIDDSTALTPLQLEAARAEWSLALRRK